MTAFNAFESLIIATHNNGKLVEIRDILKDYIAPERISSAGELGLDEPEETGSTFSENARLKAVAAYRATGKAALADDSGLEVDILGGAPGIYSARWGGETKDFNKAMQRVEHEISSQGAEATGQPARFICAMALALPDGTVHDFVGSCEGALSFPPRGAHGFGYDPIFIPHGYDKTFAEIDAKEKYRLSHRTNAFQKLMVWLPEHEVA